MKNARSNSLSQNGKRNCWPTPEQLRLMQAALLDGDRAMHAWEAWKGMVDLDTIEYASQRMLPLLYRNLARLGVQDRWMDRMKGVYRRTWYENRLLFHNMAGVLGALQGAAIETMLLKGTALVLLHYKDYGLRCMGDYDILVPTEDVSRAMNVITGLGWKPVWLDTGRQGLTEITHSCDYEDIEGRRFDLHWHVMLECCARDADVEFWKGSVPVNVEGIQSRALNPSDQILHVCVHGARWDPTPPFRWIADAIVLLRTSGTGFDWERLIRQAKERHLVLAMRDTLSLLAQEFNAGIPEQVLNSLANTHPGIADRIEYNVRTQPVEQTGPVAAFISNYWYFSRLRNKESLLQKLLGLPRFLQQYWGIGSLWHLPFVVVFRTGRRTWKLLRSILPESAFQMFSRKERPSFER